MKHRKPKAIPPSRRVTPKRLTIWVTKERATELKEAAEGVGMRFPAYLQRLIDSGWAQRNA